MLTELHTNELPEIFSRFKSCIDEKYWIRRVTQIKLDIAGKPFLKQHLTEENSIAIQLSTCSKLKQRDWPSLNSSEKFLALYPALPFSAQSLSVMDSCKIQQKKEIIRRIQDRWG